jgi:hypothetical protein
MNIDHIDEDEPQIMTWKEFKENADKQMKEKNISEDTPIEYIDISFGYSGITEIRVSLDQFGGLIIS